MQRGFHLIELLIVLSLISIITCIAVPWYAKHLIRTHRFEAEVVLNQIAVALEKEFIVHHRYDAISLSSLGFAEYIAKNHYRLSMKNLEDSYELQAIPQGEQIEKDKSCGTLILKNNGEKQISGPASVEECW